MSILDLGRILRKWWYLVILVPVLVGGATAAVCWGLLPDQYAATSSLYVLGKDDTGDVITSGNLDTVKGRAIANDVVAIMGTERVTGPVLEDLGLDSLDGYDVKVESTPENRIVSIVVTGEDPAMAADISNALADRAVEVSFEVLDVKMVNVVEYAKEPASPSGPNRVLYTGVAIVVGLVLIVSILQIRSTLNRTIPDSETAMAISGLPVWGIMPDLLGSSKKVKKPRKRGKKRRKRDSSANGANFSIPELENPCKTLLANIRFVSSKARARTIVVTSASPGEGKTTLCANLALAMAHSGKNTLLVEADLRYRNIAALMGVESGRGLFALLSGSCSVTGAVHKTQWKNLFFLDAEEGIINPSDLFASARFKTLTRALSTYFDYIVFDTPPLDEFVDAAEIASAADAVVFAVREGASDIKAVETSLAQLRAAGAKTIGLVMTFSHERERGYYTYSGTSAEALNSSEQYTQQYASFVYSDAGGSQFESWKKGLGLHFAGEEETRTISVPSPMDDPAPSPNAKTSN